MAFHAYGGLPAQLGFGGMALSMLATTTIAYRYIRRRRISNHRAWMLRSDAFIPAYQGASWLAWVVNLLWVEWYLRRGQPQARAIHELAKGSGA
jgi:hypothetical protein